MDGFTAGFGGRETDLATDGCVGFRAHIESARLPEPNPVSLGVSADFADAGALAVRFSLSAAFRLAFGAQIESERVDDPKVIGEGWDVDWTFFGA